MPQQYETESATPTHHSSGSINAINRYPELGADFAGYEGNTTRVVELETSGHTFLTAEEAEELGQRLIQHAAILRLP